jgi:hypothetical protein
VVDAGIALEPGDVAGLLGQHQSHHEPVLTRACRAARAVQVGLVVLGWVEVHDDIHAVDVQTTRRDVRRNEHRSGARGEGR